MSRCEMVCLIVFSATGLTAGIAQAVNIPSNQGTGQDGFAYSNPSVAFPLSNSYHVRPVVATVSAAHDTESLVQFDVTAASTGLTAVQVTSATLNLWVDDGSSTGFGNNPTAANPVQVDLYSVSGTWSKATLTWANKPATGSVLGAVTVDSIGHWIAYDVKSTVQGWLTTPSSNNGFLLRSNAVVGGPGNYYVVAFDSGFATGGAADGNANAPYLSIVPEPQGLLLALAATPAACLFSVLEHDGDGRHGDRTTRFVVPGTCPRRPPHRCRSYLAELS
jgi:hypothetical protein